MNRMIAAKKKKSLKPKVEKLYGEKLMESKKGEPTKDQKKVLKTGLKFATQGRDIKGQAQPEGTNLISPLVKKTEKYKKLKTKKY